LQIFILLSCIFVLRAHIGATILPPNTKVLDFQGLFVFLGVKNNSLSPLHLFLNLLVSNLRLCEKILKLLWLCDIINLKRTVRKLTDILLFGIFHFFEEKIDFSSDTIQRQLDDLSYAVSKFSPSAVAVEF